MSDWLLLLLAAIAQALLALLRVASPRSGHDSARSRIALLLQAAGMITAGLYLAARMTRVGVAPLADGQSCVILLALFLSALERILGTGATRRALTPWPALLVGLLFVLALLLPVSDKLLPALLNRSALLGSHVLLCLAGYAGFTLAALSALFALQQLGRRQGIVACIGLAAILSLPTTGVLLLGMGKLDKAFVATCEAQPVLALLLAAALSVVFAPLIRLWSRHRGADELAAQASAGRRLTDWAAVIGITAFSLGLIVGAIWANQVWGRFWIWEAKQTWAFLTWLVYAMYLRLRASDWGEGQIPLWVAAIGMALAAITAAVGSIAPSAFLDSGLHSF